MKKFKMYDQREFTSFKTRKAGAHENKRKKKEKHKKKIFEEE